MASPIQDVTALLQAWATTFKLVYADGIYDKAKRFGRTTRMWANTKRQLSGNKIQYEVKRFHNRGAQATRDLMALQPPHKPGAYDRFNVQFDHTSPAANDFTMFQAAVTTTYWDMKKRADEAFKGNYDFLQRDIDELVADVGETVAKFPHLPTDGLLATIATGGVRNDDAFIFGDTTSYTSGSSTCAIQVDAVSIAVIGQGANIEIRSSGGVLIVNNVLVTRVEPYEKVIHVKITSTSVDSAGNPVTTFNGIAATNKIYTNGSYNVGVAGSLAAFFNPSATYYRDENGTAISRTGHAHKQLMPRRVSAGTANTDLTELHLRAVGETLAWTEADGNAKVTRMTIMARDGYNQLVRLQRDERMRMIPALESQVGRELNLAYGFNGYVFHDPTLGTVAAVVDDFAEYGKIRFLDQSDWEMVQPTSQSSFEFIPSTIAGIWYAMGEADGSGTQSLRYSARGLTTAAFVCTWPENQVELVNLNTAA